MSIDDARPEEWDEVNDELKKDEGKSFLADLWNSQTNDEVNHPSHYRSDSGIEAIDAIEAWGLNFNLGNVINDKTDSENYILQSGDEIWKTDGLCNQRRFYQVGHRTLLQENNFIHGRSSTVGRN